MISKNKLEELGNMYRLFERDKDTLGFMTSKISQFIGNKGDSFKNDPKLSKEPIEYTMKVI